MTVSATSPSAPMRANRANQAQSVEADAFAVKQMQIMQDIIGGRNAAQQAFIDSHPDTSKNFESVINALFGAGSSHANEAARIAATVQDMRNAEKAYRENGGLPPKG